MKDRPSKPKKAPAKSPKPAAARAAKAAPARKRAPKPKSAPATAPAALPTHPRLLSLIVQALDAKKTEAIQVLHVAELSSITDYLVLGTATSDPHLRALRVELEKVIDAEGSKILGMDTTKDSGWLVIDAFDVMVHLFTPKNRERYRLDLLWRDAREVPLAEIG
jgi:ribosome-associated protein